MLLNGFNRPLRLVLKPSRSLLFYLCLVHACALLAIWLASMPAIYSVLLSLAIALSMLGYLFKFNTQATGLTETWIYSGQHDWLQTLPGNTVRWKQAKVHQLAGWFSAVELVNESRHRRKHLLLLKDQMAKSTFRRLQVMLATPQRYATVNEDRLA